MNKYFEDSRYYLERAVEHAKLGLAETFEPVLNRVRARLGREPEPEPDRVEAVVENVKTLEERAEAAAREALGGARHRVGSYRSKA